MSDKPGPSPFLLLGMGLAIAASLVLPTGLGYVVGDQFGVSVEMAFAGLALGVVLAVVLLRTQIRKYM